MPPTSKDPTALGGPQSQAQAWYGGLYPGAPMSPLQQGAPNVLGQPTGTAQSFTVHTTASPAPAELNQYYSTQVIDMLYQQLLNHHAVPYHPKPDPKFTPEKFRGEIPDSDCPF